MFNEKELTGQARTHVVQITEPRFAVHKLVYEPFCELCEAARKDGFTLSPFSAFRDFETQLRIWNKKFDGSKPLYDIHGVPRNYAQLTPNEVVSCILNWSALPGGSRHHWGTEIDVVDLTLAPKGYRVALLPYETAPGGVFHSLHLWLDEHIEQYGFFRPYKVYQGGMYPEPWHLSYWPVSKIAFEELTLEILEKTLQQVHMQGKDLVLARLPEIYETHMRHICQPACDCLPL